MVSRSVERRFRREMCGGDGGPELREPRGNGGRRRGDNGTRARRSPSVRSLLLLLLLSQSRARSDRLRLRLTELDGAPAQTGGQNARDLFDQKAGRVTGVRQSARCLRVLRCCRPDCTDNMLRALDPFM